MGTSFRVDRVCSRRVPCGMASIVYIGDDLRKARAAYAQTSPGIDCWGRNNQAYGVILSTWNSTKNEYRIMIEKGLEQ